MGIPTITIEPPEPSVDARLTPEQFSDVLFVACALDRVRDLTHLPSVTLTELADIVLNKSDNATDGEDDSEDEEMAEKKIHVSHPLQLGRCK
jgi:hypothetical protein